MPSAPCPDCFTGSLSTEIPIGTEETIHGLPTYVARPNGTPKGLVIMITDAFGWKLPNARVLADKYSERGDLLVYVPDFMNGHGAEPNILTLVNHLIAPASWFATIFYKPYYLLRAAAWIIPWFYFCRLVKSSPIVFEFFRALRTSPETANMKIGAAGFCWGGKFTVQLCQDPPSSRVHREGSEPGQLQSLVDTGFTAHPSFLSYPSDIDAVTKPLCIMVGDKDNQTSLAQAERAKEILEKKKAGDHSLTIIPGAKHGFAVRGFLQDEVQFKHGLMAEDQALAWFEKWFS